MFSWPTACDSESNIIQQFKFLQDHLTTDSAVEFFANVPCSDYLHELYNAGHPYYEGAIQAYLVCLRTVIPLVSRSQFLRIFEGSSPGCAATLQFMSILCLYPILENEVNDLFRELLCDPRAEILHRNDIRQMVMKIRQEYKDPFQCIGAYFNVNRDNAGFKKAQVIGELIASEDFCELMKSNSTVGAQLAHQMMKNLPDDSKQSSQLKELLSKYQKLISKDKLNTFA